jgi:redox-sensitive bicupin YhaK (pirin superfamily)
VADTIVQTFPLGFQWPTIDPFLFCVHHDDAYPAANASHGPAASLDGRDLGQDFAGIDGWRMYHGSTVPGFPSHPHRGFETVTFVRRGLVDHADSMGAAARYGRGDVQWLTAGGGIQHAEMFPLLDTAGPNPLELFQIWLNLPAADKMAAPYFTMLWDGDIPRHVIEAADGAEPSVVTVVAGELAGVTPPTPPPDSWASKPQADVAIWHVHLEANASWTMPAATGSETVRALYVFEGGSLHIDGVELEAGTGAVVRCDVDVVVGSDAGTEYLVLQGRPIGEPVAQYGPFVMNTQAEIMQAMQDYRRTQFGGWPWPVDDPVHGDAPERFARHPDGTLTVPDGRTASTSTTR